MRTHPCRDVVRPHRAARRWVRRGLVLVGAWAALLAATAPVHPVVPAVTLLGSDPVGSLEHAEVPVPGWLAIGGWAVDPDTASPVDVRVEVQGEGETAPLTWSLGPADADRPEVGASFTDVGARHGFDVRLELPDGFTPSQVSVWAANAPGTPGNEQLFGARIIDDQTDPFGSLESISATPDGYVRLRGWTADPLDRGSLLTVWVGPKYSWASGSGVPHPLPELLGHGPDNGFDSVVGGPPYFTPGPHEICVSIGFRVRLGCRTVVIASPTSSTTPPSAERLVVRADPVRHRSRLRVDVDPDSGAHDYRFRVQRRVDQRWRTVVRRSTRGVRDTRVLDLDRGLYRVVVPAQHDMRGVRTTARLRR